MDWFLYDRDLRHERVNIVYQENKEVSLANNLGLQSKASDKLLMRRKSYIRKRSEPRIEPCRTQFMIIAYNIEQLSVLWKLKSFLTFVIGSIDAMLF